MLLRILAKLTSIFGLICRKSIPVKPAAELPDRCLQNARIVPSRVDILPSLPKGGVVAEIGVAFGRYSQQILRIMQPRQFVAIDNFQLDRTDWLGRCPYAKTLAGMRHEDYYRKQFQSEIDSGQVVISKGYSHECMNTFPDAYFDMIYIDAGHDYESVSQDLAISGRKIKSGGYILLNDYTLADPLLFLQYGVVQATHEFCIQEGWEIAYLALHPHMFCDVALRKLNTAPIAI